MCLHLGCPIFWSSWKTIMEYRKRFVKYMDQKQPPIRPIKCMLEPMVSSSLTCFYLKVFLSNFRCHIDNKNIEPFQLLFIAGIFYMAMAMATGFYLKKIAPKTLLCTSGFSQFLANISSDVSKITNRIQCLRLQALGWLSQWAVASRWISLAISMWLWFVLSLSYAVVFVRALSWPWLWTPIQQIFVPWPLHSSWCAVALDPWLDLTLSVWCCKVIALRFSMCLVELWSVSGFNNSTI